MTTSDRPQTLLEATQALTDKVSELSDRLDVTERQRKRLIRLQVIVLVVFSLIAAFGIYQFERVNSALDSARAANAANHASQIQNCENTNESRAANLSLWTTVIRLSKDGSDDPAVKHELDELLGWTAILYQPHDCNDLTKVYTVPTFEQYVASLA